RRDFLFVPEDLGEEPTGGCGTSDIDGMGASVDFYFFEVSGSKASPALFRVLLS
ncbi:hypothetical protein Tco_0125577, partial [Tanacetum coccineum]